MLDTVANFAEAWKIKFNAKKCGVLVVGEKCRRPDYGNSGKRILEKLTSTNIWGYGSTDRQMP